jgi:transcriptional accessory protein Tex/SPT6
VADISEWLVSDNIAVVSGEWNQLRRDVLEMAVNKKLLPVLLQELRAKLTGNAIETTLFQLQDK